LELSSEPVKLSDVQAGRIGLAVYAMLTPSGELVPFHVEARSRPGSMSDYTTLSSPSPAQRERSPAHRGGG